MVYVAHDRDDRRTIDKVLLDVLEHRLHLDVVGGMGDLDLLFEFVGQHLDRVVGEGLCEGGHLAEHHQLLDDLRHRHAEVLGDVLDRRARVDANQVGGLHRGGVDRGDRLVVGAPAAPSAAWTAHGLVGGPTLLAARGLGVDHDTAAPSWAGSAGRALAGARVARRAYALAGALTVAGGGALISVGRRGRRRAQGRSRLARGCGARGRSLPAALPRSRHGLACGCAWGPRCGRPIGRARGGCALGGGGAPIAAERPQSVGLLDRRGGRLRRDARGLQLLEQVLARDALLLGYFMNSFLAHSQIKSRGPACQP